MADENEEGVLGGRFIVLQSVQHPPRWSRICKTGEFLGLDSWHPERSTVLWVRQHMRFMTAFYFKTLIGFRKMVSCEFAQTMWQRYGLISKFHDSQCAGSS